MTARAALAAMLAAAGLTLAVIARGTPMYSAREGRACDNCHLIPNGWDTPSPALRKRTLSCQACHVDPAGGGLRTAAGRFYGRATLPMIATSPRPTDDWDRAFAHLLARSDHATTYTDSLPQGPENLAQSLEPRFAPSDHWALGTPPGARSRFAPFQGRTGRLRADPLVRLGWDARAGLLITEGALFFPMQLDLEAGFHPVEHVTLLAASGVRGRSSGFSDTFDDSHTPYLREAFLMVHEAPFLSYAKAGRFTPCFGLRLDDHTTLTRREFELDGGLPETRVTGVEIGAAPGNPFINLSWFRSTSRARIPSGFDIFDLDQGSGAALNAGYRAPGWSLGASALARRRPLAEGGDAASWSVYGSVNPWVYSRRLPFTYQAEYDFGDRRRASGLKAQVAAFYQELDFLAGNGVNFLVAQDWADPDADVGGDESLRVSAGVQVVPIPGITVDSRVRMLFPASGKSGTDLFIQVHVWN